MSLEDEVEEIFAQVFDEGLEAIEHFHKTKDRTKFKEWIAKWNKILPCNPNPPDPDEFLDELSYKMNN